MAGPRPAQERLRRLLVMLPWLMERGDVAVATMAAHFHLSEKHLIADLEKASLCGLPPYVDELIDLWIDDGIIHAGVPRLFTRPLRLTPGEGFSLVAAGRAAMELPGADPDGPLARALAKLEAGLGSTPVVSVELEHPAHLETVQAALDSCRRVRIAYYSARRNETTTRMVSPQAVFSDRGEWYVVGDDSTTGEQRTFRIDRIDSAEVTELPFERRDVDVPLDGWFRAGASSGAEELPIVTLLLGPTASWVVERYPTIAVEMSKRAGWQQVRLHVTSDRWLERLLLRLGSDAEVVEPVGYRGSAARAASEILARYRAVAP